MCHSLLDPRSNSSPELQHQKIEYIIILNEEQRVKEQEKLYNMQEGQGTAAASINCIKS